jgi:transketolase
VSLPTVKPLDRTAVLGAARECRAVVTVEEHMVNGGLGEACAGLLAEAGIGTRFRIFGLPDEVTVSGSQPEIFRHYGLTMEGLAQTMSALLRA